MNTYTLDAIRGLDLSISVEQTHQGHRAHGLAFNNDAELVSETEARHYIGFCIPDVLHSVAAELTAHVPHANDQGILDALSARGLNCHCPD